MIVSELSTQVNDLLRPMGITRNLSAYSILCQCLELVCEQEDRLQAVFLLTDQLKTLAQDTVGAQIACDAHRAQQIIDLSGQFGNDHS